MGPTILALLLASSASAGLKDDPIGKSVRQGMEEQAAVEAIEAAQDVLARFESLERRYAQDGDFERYARDRTAVIADAEARYARLEATSKDIQRAQISQQMFNALGLAAIVKRKGKDLGKENLHEVSARTVELSRGLHLQEQEGALMAEIANFLVRDEAFYKAAEERHRLKRRWRNGVLAAAFLLATAAVVGWGLRRRR